MLKVYSVWHTALAKKLASHAIRFPPEELAMAPDLCYGCGRAHFRTVGPKAKNPGLHKPYIDGVRVFLDTDHKNLTFISNIKHSSGQLARWAMRLSEYNYELRYRPGKQMPVADCLSRLALEQELSQEEMNAVMTTFAVHISQLCEGSLNVAGTRSTGAEFMVTWGADHRFGDTRGVDTSSGEVRRTHIGEIVWTQYVRDGVVMQSHINEDGNLVRDGVVIDENPEALEKSHLGLRRVHHRPTQT